MKLKAWRKKHNLSMEKAKAVLGLSQPSISRIERGRQWPDKETMQQILDRTDGEVTPNDFVHDDDLPPTRSEMRGAMS